MMETAYMACGPLECLALLGSNCTVSDNLQGWWDLGMQLGGPHPSSGVPVPSPVRGRAGGVCRVYPARGWVPEARLVQCPRPPYIVHSVKLAPTLEMRGKSHTYARSSAQIGSHSSHSRGKINMKVSLHCTSLNSVQRMMLGKWM